MGWWSVAADVGGTEPGGDVAEGGAVGVVEVVAGGEELDGAGAAVVQGIEQAGVQALLKEDVGREAGLHHCLRVQQGAIQVRGCRAGSRMWRVGARIGTRIQRGDEAQ